MNTSKYFESGRDAEDSYLGKMMERGLVLLQRYLMLY